MKGLTKLAAVAALVLLLPGAARAEYPERTITLVVPYPAGGTIDRLAREFGDHLAIKWKKAVVVENRGGGNGVVGVELVRGQEPDGYTLLVGGGSTHSVGPATEEEIRYDPIADFTAVGYFGETPMVLTAGKNVDGLDFQGLVAKAKASGKAFTYGSVGNSTVLAGTMLSKSSGMPLRQVNYKQFGPALIDIVRGDVDLGVSSLSIVYGNIQQKMLRPLLVTSPERSPLLPDVPAGAEFYKGFEVSIWFGLFGPAKMQAAVADKIHDELIAFQRDKDRAERWNREAFVLRERSRSDFATYLADDLRKWKETATQAGLGRK